MLYDPDRLPVLGTDRLRLRAPRREDEEAFIGMLLDEDVSRFVFGPFDRSSAWRSFAASIGHWALLGYGQFIVERLDTGTFAGRVGLVNMPGWPALEIAWTLDRSAWGKGYAVEAAEAVRHHAIETLTPQRLISLVDPHNIRSVRVAERLGASPVERILFHGCEVDVWEHRLNVG
jgi:RimJ/RimL family protein N-acetyltransferase